MVSRIHWLRSSKRTDVFTATTVECGVFTGDAFFGRTRRATGDRSKVTCARCLGTGKPRGRKPTGRQAATRQELAHALRVIYTAVRGDEKSEYWTLRKYLDKRKVYNGDLSDGDRLVEAVCKVALGL